MITHERLKEVLRYYPLTGEWEWLYYNGRRRAGETAGYIHPRSNRRVITVDGKKYFASRLAYFYMKGEWPESEVDHEDVDPTNDAWYNLRPATHAQNVANQRVSSKSKSGVKYVWRNKNGKYTVRFRGKEWHGFTLDEAKEHARSVAIQANGAYARS